MTDDFARLCYERCRREQSLSQLGVCSVLCNALGYAMRSECPEAIETHRRAVEAELAAVPPRAPIAMNGDPKTFSAGEACTSPQPPRAPEPGLRERVQAAIDKAMLKIFPQSFSFGETEVRRALNAIQAALDAAPAEPPAPAKNEIPQDDDMKPTIQHEAPADDWSSRWQETTLAGLKVLLIEPSPGDEWPLQGVIREVSGVISVCHWTKDGKEASCDRSLSLVPVAPPAPEVSDEDVERAKVAYLAIPEPRTFIDGLRAALVADSAAREGR